MNIDSFLPVVFVLLVLSMITEKVTNFVRGYFPHLRDIWNATGGRMTRRMIVTPPSDPHVLEENKARDISLLSILIGAGVSLATNTNFFVLISVPELSQHSFVPVWPRTIGEGLGVLLTGCFLGFGSKFFHDLLDLLLQVKNLRKNLNEEKLRDAASWTNIKQVDEAIAFTDDDLVDLAIKQHREKLSVKRNITGIGRMYQMQEGKQVPAVRVTLSDGERRGLPDELPVSLPSGRIVSVPVHYVTNAGKVRLHYAVSPSLGIGNRMTQKVGTVTCAVQSMADGRRRLLTCYHAVICHGVHPWELYQPAGGSYDDVLVKSGNKKKQVGTLSYGQRSHFFDIALLEPAQGISYDNGYLGGEVRMSRSVATGDINTRVRLQGRQNPDVRVGKIIDCHHFLSDVPYDDGPWDLYDTIVVSGLTAQPSAVTEPGDSGTLIVDENNVALGMAIAGDDTHTYALPIEDILKSINHRVVES